jgi:hypothetical protein
MPTFRYRDTPKTKNEMGRRTLETTIPITVPKDVRDIYIYTRVGDRLDLLAHKYLGDRTKWVYLAAVNKLKEMVVEPGIQLRIPYDPELLRKEWIKQNKER